jgi:hypothetical protein
MQAPQARPTGITILAILAAIGGVFGLLGGLAIIGLGGVAAGYLGGTEGAAVGGLAVFGGLVVLVTAVLALAFAYGAWTLKPWAWMLGVIAEVLSLIGSALAVAGGSSISSQIIGVLIALGILYYLNTPNVKAAFGRT